MVNARQKLLAVFVVLLAAALGIYQYILETTQMTVQASEIVLVMLFLFISLVAYIADKHLYRRMD